MRIEQVDPGDARRVDDAVAVLAAAHPVDFPDDPPFCPSWELGRIRHPLPAEAQEHWVALDGDRILGVLMLERPLRDNLSTLLGELTVHPDARRRGVGRALAAQARERAAVHGRTQLITFSMLGGAAEEFLREQGFEIGLNEHRQLMRVTPENRAAWQRLHDEALPYAEGYRLVQWQDVTPEEHVDGLAYLTHRISTDAPLQDLNWEAEHWDGERVRQHDRAMAAWGRRIYTTAAIHEQSGEMAGYSTLSWAVEEPTHAWQWNTIVDPKHRGHRLGALVKVANHAFAFVREPATRTVSTWNAESNRHMNAINTALGFAPIDRWAESQLSLG